MASVLFTIGGPMVNALTFSDTNFVFSRMTDHGTEQRKIHDLAHGKFQRARDEWNRDRMKRLDLINKRLRERNEERAYIKNVDKAMLEYLQIFYHPSEVQKNGGLLFAVVGTGIATYALYKYLK